MPVHPLKVLLVSADRGILGHVGRFLRKFGYSVSQCAHPSRAATLLGGDRPDFLVLDWDLATPEAAELCRSAGGDRRRKYVFTFLMTDPSHARAITEAIQ